jgi:hypothetical protein
VIDTMAPRKGKSRVNKTDGACQHVFREVSPAWHHPGLYARIQPGERGKNTLKRQTPRRTFNVALGFWMLTQFANPKSLCRCKTITVHTGPAP